MLAYGVEDVNFKVLENKTIEKLNLGQLCGCGSVRIDDAVLIPGVNLPEEIHHFLPLQHFLDSRGFIVTRFPATPSILPKR